MHHCVIISCVDNNTYIALYVMHSAYTRSFEHFTNCCRNFIKFII